MVGKPEGKRPLGQPTHRWEDNIRKDHKVPSSGMDWSDLPQVAGSCECGKEPSNFIKRGIVDQLRTCQFSRRTLLHLVSWLVSELVSQSVS